MTKCEFCGKPLDDENAHYMNETTMCEDCLEEKTVLCQHCGERIWHSDAIREDNYTLYNHCYEYNFIHCSDCGRLICEDDACYDEDSERDYCSSCYASTKEILWKAVINTKLFDTLKLGHYEKIPLEEGQILKITPRGKLSYSNFDYDEYAAYGSCRWYDRCGIFF